MSRRGNPVGKEDGELAAADRKWYFPAIPDFAEWLQIRRLSVGEAVPEAAAAAYHAIDHEPVLLAECSG